MKVIDCWSAILGLTLVMPVWAQDASELPVSLARLVAEADANNSRIAAADHAWRAATQVAQQVTALPDPKLTVQQFSVGSPKPFAGYTNSDFAYIGIGGSQELPYPGKLQLRGKIAEREADVRQTAIGITRKDIDDAVKTAYLQLASLRQTVAILQQNKAVLDALIEDVILRYKVGQGSQQDILQAQIERTKVVREIAVQHQQLGRIQADLKSLLHRDQGSADIAPEELTESVLSLTSAELLDLTRRNNPEVQASAGSARKQDAQLASARREGKPDFEIGYMYENTDRKYRDYYMLTLNVKFPRRQKLHAEIAEEAEMVAQAKDSLSAELQQQLAATQTQYVQADSDAELLKDYREGLLPQSEAAYQATLSAYAANRETLTRVLESLTALLTLRLEVVKTLADHEIALAHLESLTGADLR